MKEIDEVRGAGKQKSGEALTKAAIAYLEMHSTEKFSLQEIAASLYVNGCYLLRTFRQQTGVTLLHCHHSIRCEKAKELLTGTDQSISGIGETVGYISSSHFSHIFRKMVGCTPTEYRKAHSTQRERNLP